MKTVVPPFQFSTPSNWSCLNVVLAAPATTDESAEGMTFRSNLFATVDEQDPSVEIALKEYVATQMAELKQSEIFIRMIAEPQTTRTKGGIEGFVYEYMVKSPQEGVSVHQIQFVTVHGHSIYAFTWSQVAGQPFLKAKSEFMKMLESMERTSA